MARNLWSDRPLGAKLAVLVVAGAVVLAVFAAIAVRALDSTGATADELLASAEVTQDVLTADMVHDAVRGDVLQALVSGGQGDLYHSAVADRVRVVRDDAASTVADASVDLVVCNPPFHLGAAVVTGAADRLFAAAGRVLRPGGELWCVYNNRLPHRAALRRLVGPTRVASSDRRFTVTVSTRRS